MGNSKKRNIPTRPQKDMSEFEIYNSKIIAKNLSERKQERIDFVYLILCFLVPFIIFGVILYISGVFDTRSILYSDCKAQYFPFLREYQTKLQNGGSFLWSWNTGMGSNFLAMIGYYISSPLNLLTLFIPADRLIDGMALLIMTKISLAGLFMGIFLRKVFNRCDLSTVAFSCCYSFCNFMMGYYWNVIWLDAVALLPLVALGVYELVFQKKYKIFVISLALTMISSYYIGYMVCLFTFFWFFMLWAKHNKSKDKSSLFVQSLFRIGIASVIAIALSAFLVLPSYIQLGNTVASNEAFPEEIEFYNSFVSLIGNTFGFHDPVTMEGLPNTYTGMICLVLFVIFLFSKQISSREKLVDCGFVVFLLLSLNTNILDFLWHGLHYPNQIPYRFAFIFSFILIFLAYRAFTLIQYLNAYDFIFMLVTLTVFSAFAFVSLDDSKINMTQDAVLYGILACVVYVFLISLYNSKILNKQIFIAAISLVIVFEMGCNCYIGVKTVGNSSLDYPQYYEEEQVILDDIKNINEDDNEFYRIEHTNISSKNDGVYYGYHGIGQFSSTSDKNVLATMGKLSLVAKRSSWQYLHTSPLTTSLYNIKYIIARDGYIADDIYLKDITSQLTENDKPISVYEYDRYLPLGFMANNQTGVLDLNEYNYSFEIQNEVFKAMTGLDEDIYTEFECQNSEISKGKIEDGNRTGKFYYSESAANEKVTFTYIVPKAGMVYAYANFRDDSNRVSVLSNSIDHDYDVDARRYIFPVGEYEAGDKITFSAYLMRSSGSFELDVATFDNIVFDKGYEILNSNPLNISKYTDTLVEGKIKAEENGFMYTSIPNESGWTLYVDGVKAEKVTALGAFAGVYLEKGEHQITFKYMPKGFIPGMIISITALVIFVLYWIFEERINKILKIK